MLERWVERVIFASRWLLAPLYIALALALFGVILKFGQGLLHFLPHIFEIDESRVILDLLSLVDLALTASLVVIVIFSGYEKFVTRNDPEGHQDWPEWMTKISFSIVAISAVQLLRAFLDLRNFSDRDLGWYAGIHLVFVVSAIILAWTDRISGESSH